MALLYNRFHQKVLVCILLFLSALYLYRRRESFTRDSFPAFVPTHESSSLSIKPIAYIFPQYYVFEDNNRLHGENFTEWVNVQRVTHNSFGLETIRPHDSIGMYDGMSLQTRRRYGKFLKDSSFYGAVFHHYWFVDRPIMEHVIEAMLADGEPDIPFMLSWANEPWSARWDGGKSGQVLIAQEYGLHEMWRKHFDWLLPFFRHPKYIRSEGRVQFIVYRPEHMGHIAPQMFAAFRQWAVEEGLGGMDIIETRWSGGPLAQWEGHPPDANNEFMPHAGGMDTSAYSSIRRVSRVYHRGTMACWDTTPRHATDNSAVALPFCHPRTWHHHLVEMFRTIKADPNPVGSENFFFVNALNEWGEGNAIEPTAQFGFGYGNAMKNAMAISDKEHQWLGTKTASDLKRDREMAVVMNKTADVCVLSQHNMKWRALVFRSSKEDFPSLGPIVIRALDPRIKQIAVLDKVVPIGDDREGPATDWVIDNMATLDQGCASARYLLLTSGANTYSAHAFDLSYKETGDLIGLTYESKTNLLDLLQAAPITWEERCTRFDASEFTSIRTSSAGLESNLAATLVNLPKFLSEHHKYTINTNTSSDTAPLIQRLTHTHNWSFSAFSSSPASSHFASALVQHNPSYSSCLSTGNFWFDSPVESEVGCYTSGQFMNVYGGKSPNLKDFDLQFFMENGKCVRYRREAYEKIVGVGDKLSEDVAQSGTGGLS